MSFDDDKPFYEAKGAVLDAKAMGFYKIKGLAAKSGRCRHISCGATKPGTCNYWSSLADHEHKMKTGIWYGNQPYTPAIQAGQVTSLNNLKNYHTGCAKDWCVRRNNNKLRPANLGQMVDCTRHHLEPYSEVELAKPDVKPESIAVQMVVSFDNGARDYCIALYDLIDDKWFNDMWWTIVGYKNKNLMPHANTKEYAPPKELVNIGQVITALKAAL